MSVALFWFTALPEMKAQPSAALAPDDPKLFHALFLSSAAQQNAAVNAAEAKTFIALAQTSAQRLAVVDARCQTYLAAVAAKKQSPHPAALQGFAAEQNLLDWRGIHELRKGLSPKGWQQLRAWVNGPFLASVNAGAVAAGSN